MTLAGDLTTPRALSPTSAGTWRTCGLKYALSYLYGWKEAGTEPQLLGNAVHTALERLYALPPADRTRHRASALLAEVAPVEAAAEQFARLTSRAPEVVERVAAHGEASLDGLWALEDPTEVTVDPAGLEVWVEAELYGAPVRGRIDRLHDAAGADVVADYKTGKVPKPRFVEKAFAGLWTYAAALAAADPARRLPDRIDLLYLAGPERLSRPVVRGYALEHARALALLWRAALAAVAARRVTATTGPLCDWCAFQPACPAQTRAVLPGIGTAEHDALLEALTLQRRRPGPAREPLVAEEPAG